MKKYLIIVKFILIGLIYAVVLISCSTTQSQPSLSVVVPYDYLGVVHGGNSGTPEEYKLINEIGAVWLLQTFYWSGIEREKDNFNFTFYDNFVDNAKTHGNKIVALLGYATPWINDGRNGRYISKKNIDHFLNYIEVTVKRYKGKVDVWQIWNEPNLMYWRGPNKEFFELSKLAAKKIRQIDPDAYILGGGFVRAPKLFIKKMNKAGAMENLNGLSFHPYALNPTGSLNIHDNFNKTISSIDFKGDKWITEIGFPTAGIFPTKVSLEKLPSYVIKCISGSAIRGSRALLWYEFKDRYNYGEFPNNYNSERYFGLTYPDRSKKAGGWAYELCGRYLPGSQYHPELPLKENIKSNIVALCFIGKESKPNTLIIWNDKNDKQNIKLSLSSNIIIHDISTGNQFSSSDEIILEVTNQPLFITWQGSSIPVISKLNKVKKL